MCPTATRPMAMPERELETVPVGAPATASMERLDFTLPDFTRVAWVGDRAREVWEPRFARITAAWLEIEWRAVLAGVRSCAVAVASPEEFITRAQVWVEEGLAALPIEMMGLSGQPYSATPVPMQPGQPFAFRLVVGRPADTAAFKAAWDAADQEAIGDLLGYPSCCREFFRRVWVDDALVDTTWPMAVATAAAPNGGLAGGATTVEVAGPPQANILWRWMGARAVPHLPCRFDCPATVSLANRLVAVGRDAGFEEEMEWLLEILSWPVEWSALHGIAEIKTPLLKVSTRTDATARRYVVRRQGDAYPSEGADGLRPPFVVPVKLRLTGTRGFRRGLDNAAAGPSARPIWYARDNGFASAEAMDDAHRPIVDAAIAALGGAGGHVMDLGCGNGALLEELVDAAPGVVPFGVDVDPARIAHARTLHPDHAANFVVGDVFDDPRVWADGRRFALALLMPGRLLEARPEHAEALRAWLRRSCDQVLVYAYGDWLSRAGSLAGLAQQAGLAVTDGADRPVSLATVPEAPEEASHGT